MVSTQGGFPYGWRSDSKELVYRSTDGVMMSVGIQASESGIVAGQPVELFRNAGLSTNMASDGKRFLTIDAPGGDVRRPIVVLMNWQR